MSHSGGPTPQQDAWVRDALGLDVAAYPARAVAMAGAPEPPAPAAPPQPAPPQPPPPQPAPPKPPPVVLTGEALELSTGLAKALPGSPERAKLVASFAKLSTHVKPPPDRVVLGKWEPPGKGGYIDAAKEKGGVWYETPEGSYGVVGRDAAWESNKAFLEQQMQQGIPKLEFTNVQLDQAVADAARAKGLPEKMPARLKEVQFLEEAAAQYGYTRVGNSYVKAPK